MQPEHRPRLAASERRRLQDLAWIEANRTFLWLMASLAWEQSERGVLVVDLTPQPDAQGQPVTYVPTGELELEDAALRRHLRDYNPHREFILLLHAPNVAPRLYLGAAPQPGWWDGLRSPTPYPLAAAGLDA